MNEHPDFACIEENDSVGTTHTTFYNLTPSSGIPTTSSTLSKNLEMLPLETINLNYTNLEGTAITITGRVFSQKKPNKPIPYAKVEIWHSDTNGQYHKKKNIDPTATCADYTTLSGYTLTNREGMYAFKTIIPGLYGTKARHFHLRISANWHNPMLTTIYFENDPRIEMDPEAYTAAPWRMLSVSKDSDTLGIKAALDLFLP